MALSANTVWEFRTGGSDTNGGGFVTGSGGTDYSQQNSKNTSGVNISVTDAVTNGTTTVTSATANFTSALVGNIVYMTPVGLWRQVVSVTNSTTIVVDLALSANTGVTMNIGGALASPGIFSSTYLGPTAGNIGFIKYDPSPFLISLSSGGSGGVLSPNVNKTVLCGYDVTRTVGNNDANRPTLKVTANTTNQSTYITSLAQVYVYNLIINKNGFGGSGFVLAAGAAINCTVIGAISTYYGFQLTTTGMAIRCSAYSCVQAGFSLAALGTAAVACVSYSNAVGFTCATGGLLLDCIAYSNSSYGFQWTGSGVVYALNCIAYNNTSGGFFMATAATITFLGCIAEANGGWGFYLTSAGLLLSCAAYGNSSGTYTGTSYAPNFVTVTAGSVFVAPGSGNFALNSTANQGALLRASNYDLNTLLPGLTVGFLDIGAVQHQDSPANISVECHNTLVRDGIGIAAY